MKESTKRFFRVHGWRHPLNFLHGYFYFTRYDLYVKGLLRFARRYIRFFPRGRALFEYFFKRYHYKVVTHEQMGKLLTLEEDVEVDPETSARIIPFEKFNRILLKQPRHIAVMDCPCRLEKGEKGCRPLNVCFAVGEPVVSFWLEHCADKYHARRISSEEALDILRRERERGHVATAWFKDATGGHTGVFCNCCKCCCGGLEAVRLADMLQVEDPPVMAAPSGYSARVNRSLCNGCGACVEVCPFDAVSLDGEDKSVLIYKKCMGCGACVDKCPQGARSLVRDPRKGVPLDVDELVLHGQGG
jgi:ferredoxin